jgi:phosphoglycerate dehydrogenase-like enzyme
MTAAPDSQRVAAGAIAGLLALARAFPQRLQAQREHRWLQLRREAAPADVQGQTVLLIGVGAVGAAVARFAQALDMRVIGVRRAPEAVAAVDEIHGVQALPAVLPRADWVVLACPLTPETHHLLDAAALACLRPGAGIINVIHPDLVDEGALLAALQCGQVGSTYLDGADGVPLPAASLLRAQPGVMVGGSASF